MDTQLFKSAGRRAPAADTTNAAGGVAYAVPPKQALAQYVMTGCFGATYYASGQEQLDAVVRLLEGLGAEGDLEYVAKLAVAARSQGFMKDGPAVLTAWLCINDRAGTFIDRVFHRVIDNGKMLSNFVKVMRSGVLGAKGLGSRGVRLVRAWLAARRPDDIFRQSVGQGDPSFADILRLVHPNPGEDVQRRTLYGYLSGRNPEEAAWEVDNLPQEVRLLERFRKDQTQPLPNAPWLALTSLPLTEAHWAMIAESCGWHALRMNLNTFGRHGVWKDQERIESAALRLRSSEAIKRSRVFPYQILAAYMHADANRPFQLNEALHDAMELATHNVPRFEGETYVAVDVSASMRQPATQSRGSATSKMRCVDVAALFASAVLRVNPHAKVIPFHFHPLDVRLEPRDTVMTNARRLAELAGGGTNCSSVLSEVINAQSLPVDNLIFVSDNESWVDSQRSRIRGGGTALMEEWVKLKGRCKNARLACIDITPHATSQTKLRPDILQVGGFNDQVFKVVSQFLAQGNDPKHWVDQIEAVSIDEA